MAAYTDPVLPGSDTGGCWRLVCWFQTSFVTSLKAGMLTHVFDLCLDLESKVSDNCK